MRDQIINRVIELETLFSSNQYNGVGVQPFVIEKGNIPIMLSAPHAINQFKEGQVKWADRYTGGIVKYLHEVTECHVIYSCMFTKTDPNYDAPEENEYQGKLKDYVSKNRIMLLLDLHGSSKRREYAVEMGTAPKPNHVHGYEYEEDPSLHNFKFIAEIIKSIFEEKFCSLEIDQKEVWKNVHFTAGAQNTITKFISENTDTPCIQLEINGNYRNPENQEEFVSLIEALVEIINYFAKYGWNSI